MVGTKAGGIKASKKCKELFGKDWYRNIGAKGGRNGHTGGFASNPALAAVAGRRGGENSRRGWKLIQETDTSLVFKNKKTGELDVKLK